VFLAYVCFVQWAVLNVLTGVFCQNAIESAAHDEELVTQAILQDKQMYVDQLNNIFQQIDKDESGAITINEFKAHLENEKMRAYFESLGLETGEVWKLFKLMDMDSGSCIELDEFVSGCMRLKGQAKSVDLAILAYEQKWLCQRLAFFMHRTEEAFSMMTGRPIHDFHRESHSGISVE